MKSYKRTIMAMICLLAVIGFLLPSGAWAVKEIKIGVIYPLTGGAAAAGRELRAGAELAADIANTVMADLPMSMAKKAGIKSLGGAKIKLNQGREPPVKVRDGSPATVTLARGTVHFTYNSRTCARRGRFDVTGRCLWRQRLDHRRGDVGAARLAAEIAGARTVGDDGFDGALDRVGSRRLVEIAQHHRR